MATRTPVATDNFNRASLGGDWTVVSSGNSSVTIGSSTVFRGTGGASSDEGPGMGTWASDSFADDQYVSIEVTFGNYGIYYNIGVMLRSDGAAFASCNMYYVLLIANDDTNPTIELGKRVGGSWSSLYSESVAFSSGDTLEAEVEGTSLRVFKNGTQLTNFDTTDSDISSGSAGALGAGGTDAVSGDNWIGGDLSGATDTTIIVPTGPWY